MIVKLKIKVQFCKKCGVKGHDTRDHKDGIVKRINAVSIDNKTEFERKKSELGPCPLCNADHHTWRNKYTQKEYVSDRLSSCAQFRLRPIKG